MVPIGCDTLSEQAACQKLGSTIGKGSSPAFPWASQCCLSCSGHTLSWGAGYPDILADCYDSDGSATGEKGPMNPASNETYTLLWKLLREISSVFPDTYVHLGGDEVPFDCWLVRPCCATGLPIAFRV